MKTYIGTKIIQAEKMCEHNFLVKVKRQSPHPDMPDREGYKVVYPDGYTS